MPKEAMPLIDTPIINHIIWEAARSGVSRIHLVLSNWKRILLDEFISGRRQIPEDIREDLPRNSLKLGIESIELITYTQNSNLGVADAISCALPNISGPFLVILADNLVMSEHLPPQICGVENASTASKKIVELFQNTGSPVVGVCKVDQKELQKYGVVEINGHRASRIVEKPLPGKAPSDYALCGRYVFPAETSDILDLHPTTTYGELQSIMLLNHFIKENTLGFVKYEGSKFFDSGDPIGWLKSQIVHGLCREDLSSELTIWLQKVLSE